MIRLLKNMTHLPAFVTFVGETITFIPFIGAQLQQHARKVQHFGLSGRRHILVVFTVNVGENEKLRGHNVVILS